MQNISLAVVLINLSFLSVGCVSDDSLTRANKIAVHAGLISENLQTKNVTIATWSRITPPVRSLRSVTVNLDVAYVNALHRVTAMPDAESAIQSAPMLRTLPQIHYSGEEDKTVPPAVARRFQQAVGGQCAQVEVIGDMAHGSDWAALWPQLVAKDSLRC